MANVVFKRGSAVEIAAVPVTDGYILWDTTNNIMYMDNGQRRLIFGVGGPDGIRPVEFGGTGGSTPADAAAALLLDSLDASPLHVTANTDLDNYISAGVYSCATPSVAVTVANNPWTTGTFTLIVRYIESSNTLLQWLVGVCQNKSEGCGWYFRARVNGVFFPWQAVNTGANGFEVDSETQDHTLNANLSVNGTINARQVIGARFEDLRDVIVCDEMPTSVIAGNWYAVKGKSEDVATTGTVQLPVHVDDFHLTSTWTCNCRFVTDGSFGQGYKEKNQTTPTTVTETVTFNFSIPQDATIVSTKVHSTWGGTMYGAALRKVAGATPDSDGFVTLSNPSVSDTSIDVPFTFKGSLDDPEQHFYGFDDNEWYAFDHASSAKITDVYLLIEYVLPDNSGGGILTPYNLYRA